MEGQVEGVTPESGPVSPTQPSLPSHHADLQPVLTRIIKLDNKVCGLQPDPGLLVGGPQGTATVHVGRVLVGEVGGRDVAL